MLKKGDILKCIRTVDTKDLLGILGDNSARPIEDYFISVKEHRKNIIDGYKKGDILVCINNLFFNEACYANVGDKFIVREHNSVGLGHNRITSYSTYNISKQNIVLRLRTNDVDELHLYYHVGEYFETKIGRVKRIIDGFKKR